MSAEKDITLDEKRVYGAKGDRTEVFVATEVGLAQVSVSDALVGEFGLVHRGETRDVAAGRELVVATDEDVLLARESPDGPEFEPTGFGPAVAVSTDEGVVASDGERVAELGEAGWETRCELDGVRAVDGGLVAADSGLHRLDGTHVGLSGARDVSTAGTPLAATDDGLYYLGNGWMAGAEGAFEVVAGDHDGARAHAATADALYEMAGGPDAWREVDLPVEGRVADVVHAATTYAVTGDGTFLSYDASEGAWRDRTLGLPGVCALAVVGGD